MPAKAYSYFTKKYFLCGVEYFRVSAPLFLSNTPLVSQRRTCVNYNFIDIENAEGKNIPCCIKIRFSLLGTR